MFNDYMVIAFIVLSVATSALFFFLYKVENNKFIMYWGLSWMFYSVALICLWMNIRGGLDEIMEIKKIFDMYSILAFLFGAYKFCRIEIPKYWGKFSIYLTVWLVFSVYLNLELLSVSLPIFMFELFMTGMICYILIRYLKEARIEKIFYCMIFILWGGMKAFLSLYETGYSGYPNVYLIEMLYSTLINICIFIIYLRYIRREMARTERQFEIIVENAADAIFYFTYIPKPTFLYITPSIENITGYGVQTFYNNPRALLEIVSKEYIDIVNKIFFSETDDTVATSEVFKINHKKGYENWVEMNVSLIRENEKIVAIEGIMRDITQMKTVQNDLITSKQSRDLLLSYISHELKTPITSILGYVTAIKEGVISDEKEKNNAIEIISRKSILLERMILDLFQLSQMETNQYSFLYEHMDCLDLAEYIRSNALSELKSSGIKHNFIIEKADLKGNNIIVDPVRLNQVVINLVNNAIKYTKEKNIITIKCYANEKKKTMIIDVMDKGIGISEENLPHVFEHFFKANNESSEKVQGSGLGLALSKEIVEAHKGHISVKSSKGKGSKFSVVIPMYYE